jgi:hypothetical protein
MVIPKFSADNESNNGVSCQLNFYFSFVLTNYRGQDAMQKPTLPGSVWLLFMAVIRWLRRWKMAVTSLIL